MIIMNIEMGGIKLSGTILHAIFQSYNTINIKTQLLIGYLWKQQSFMKDWRKTS
jgi:hypothetical protein